MEVGLVDGGIVMAVLFCVLGVDFDATVGFDESAVFPAFWCGVGSFIFLGEGGFGGVFPHGCYL